MTTKTRRTFTDEFKREAVSLLAGSGRPLTQVATELGIQPSMLRGWQGNGNDDGGADVLPGVPSSWHPCAIGRAGRDPAPVEGVRSGADRSGPGQSAAADAQEAGDRPC